MSILFVLIPLGLVLVGFGAWAFFWAVNNGQFDDLDTPAIAILADEEEQAGRTHPPGDRADGAVHPAPPQDDGRTARDSASASRQGKS